MPKIFPFFGKFLIASTMLTSSVLIALSMTLDTDVLAQPTKAPIPTPPTNQPTKAPITTPSSTNQPTKAPIPTPPTNQPTSPIGQKLLGQWQSKDSSSNPSLTFIFSPDGKLYILSPNSQKPMAVEFKYSINPTPQPMHLDITVSAEQKQALTIFEFTPDGQLRLQLDNTDPGQPRPTAFSPTATLFTKVSENTKLPENVKIIDLRL
ncbi:hypothetical protein BV372_13900 [Nostoc sp. T09]|uniref:hypothetical protein n=1 Tax=Nostoc sp. T09 TaxID=1932621 RepID=UPI000A387412|nr:hypothetical protein [Nostoc sp. T09]OUL34490.1 hypothetical protein BV372_13900 [Nostoc sp. T09]